jgi:hypothetical protein
MPTKTGVLATATPIHRNTHSVWALRHDPRPGSRRQRVGDSVTSEATVAWALADIVSVCFAAHDNICIYTALGAGETYAAIGQMLDIAVRKRHPLPATLLSTLAVWLDCYIGDEHEPTIRSLLSRVEPQAHRTTVPAINDQAIARTRRDGITFHESSMGSRFTSGRWASLTLALADDE